NNSTNIEKRKMLRRCDDSRRALGLLDKAKSTCVNNALSAKKPGLKAQDAYVPYPGLKSRGSHRAPQAAR
ncbi:MAG TPA: hypothetical protein VK129_04820, partial [Terriglobales bacterium]|nr:hypothetical protein [Terriglobales bacterium]